MNYITRNIIFWFIALIGGFLYHNFINPFEFSNFFIVSMIIVGLIEILINIRYLEKEYLQDESEEIEEKDNL